jgi:predicted ABC-type ATPase
VARRRGRIVVAGGTNGAGKSAIVGEFMAEKGGAYFNPDLFARQLVAAGLPLDEANGVAWKAGFDGLRRAIAAHEDFSFETTLGGRSIVEELHRAIEAGLDVCIWYVGLATPELHVARVHARVARGGHDIPTAKIRERYPKSLANLVSLVGRAAEIHVFDNSAESVDGTPAAQLVFRMRGSKLIEPDLQTLLAHSPEWAKPLVAAAVRVATPIHRGRAKKK